MSRYRYRAYDHTGALKEGDIEARSRERALDALRQRGQFPIELTADDGAGRAAVRWWEREITLGSGELPLAGLMLFSRELSTLVKAEIPIDEALRIVSLQPLMPRRIKAATLGVLDAVRQGQSLSVALASRAPEFPEYYWRLVQAGEASGSLGDALDDLSAFLERSNEVRSQVGSALLYPAVLLVAAVAAITVVMTVLLPTVVPLFKDAGAPLPASLAFLVGTQNFVAAHWLALLIGLGGLLAGLIAAWRQPPLRLGLDRALLRLPVVGQLIADRETSRFARTLSTLSRNGVPLLEAVRISGAVMQNAAFSNAAASAGQALQEGGTLSAPLVRSGLFSELSMRLLAVGEQTGQLETMLMRVATIYETALQRQLARLLSLLTPVLTLVIGAVVGGLILSVMGAILKVNELAGL